MKMRTSKFVTISLPSEQLKIAQRLAKKENRTMSELFREALRRYQQEEWRPDRAVLAQFRGIVEAIRQDAKAAGMERITKAEINAEVEAARKEIREKHPKTRKRSGT